jgi:phosphoglycerate dehydrogenase-like enzyme
MTSAEPVILLDPHPRHLDLIFSPRIPADHRARRTPNTVLGAHRAGNIPEIWTGMGEMVVDDLELILRGLPPQRCQRAQLETVNRLRSMPAGALKPA